MKVIELNKEYDLDLGSLSPVKIRTIRYTDEGVICEYLNSSANRIEEISYELFNLNGLDKLESININDLSKEDFEKYYKVSKSEEIDFYENYEQESLAELFEDDVKKRFRINEIKKRVDKSDNILLFDRDELDSFKKITKTTQISDLEVLTDDGWVDIEALHETIPYEVYHLKLADGKELKCADNHIVFYKDDIKEVFVKNLNVGDKILVEQNDILSESEVIEVTNLGYEEVMYDLELKEGSNRRYYTNGILSHNTYLAKLLAEHVYGDGDALIKVDMSEFMEKHTVSRLIGAPPGYVGYDQGGQLTEKVRRKPHCVVLLDEIEKAHEDIFNIMLQIFDEGVITDGLGRKINFKNALIIMTSNIGVKELNQFGKSIGFETPSTIANEEARNHSIIEKALKKKFKPEFLNRIDESIIFNSLTKDDINKIIYNEVDQVRKRLVEIGYKLEIDTNAVEFLAKEGYDENYGARPLARTIQRYVEDQIADEILSSNINEGETIKITFDTDKSEIIVKSEKPEKPKK